MPAGDDALAEQVSDLADLADRFMAEGVSEEDAKYMAQRAYNAHRGKRAYEAKLSRAASRRPDRDPWYRGERPRSAIQDLVYAP